MKEKPNSGDRVEDVQRQVAVGIPTDEIRPLTGDGDVGRPGDGGRRGSGDGAVFHRLGDPVGLEVERLGAVDTTVDLDPVLLVDGDSVLATPEQLAGASVSAKVVDETRGPKIEGFTYKSKTRNRRRWGHRQTYSPIEITGITRG